MVISPKMTSITPPIMEIAKIILSLMFLIPNIISTQTANSIIACPTKIFGPDVHPFFKD